MRLEESTTIPEIHETIVMLRELSADEKTREEAFLRERRLRDDFEIKPFLAHNKAEVTRMYVTEYDHDKALAEMLEEGREEGREEGIEEGIEKGEIRMLVGLLKDGLITLEKAAERVNMTPYELKERALELGESWYL